MAVSQPTKVLGARVAILLPVGSPSERIAAIMSLELVIAKVFGGAIHSFLHPASFDQKQWPQGTHQVYSNNICLVVVDTSYDVDHTILVSKVRNVKAKIDHQYFQYCGPAPWLQQGIHITVGPIYVICLEDGWDLIASCTCLLFWSSQPYGWVTAPIAQLREKPKSAKQ